MYTLIHSKQWLFDTHDQIENILEHSFLICVPEAMLTLFSLWCKKHILKGREGFLQIFSISFSLKCDLNQLDYGKRGEKNKKTLPLCGCTRLSNALKYNSMRGSILFHDEGWCSEGLKGWFLRHQYFWMWLWLFFSLDILELSLLIQDWCCSSLCVEMYNHLNIDNERNKSLQPSFFLLPAP